MKIYTRSGDAGQTGLFGGGRVSKDDPRVAAYGDVDELNAALGVARATGLGPLDDPCRVLQDQLFTVGGVLATHRGTQADAHIPTTTRTGSRPWNPPSTPWRRSWSPSGTSSSPVERRAALPFTWPAPCVAAPSAR